MSKEADVFGLQYSLVSIQPRILLIGMDIGETGFKLFADGSTSLDHLCDLVGSDGHIIINPWWSITDGSAWQSRLESIESLAKFRPSIGLHFFCNTQAEVDVLSARGISAILMNHNTFSNENTFNVTTDEKVYSAIYNAKMTSFKRHELAKEVNNLALLYSKFGDLVGYYPRTRLLLKDAIFLNGDPRDDTYKMFNSIEVCRYLNQAHVGLCLSKTEGAMYASIEYLLCGLPIVSTESTGGRDLFFDDRFCTIVPSDAAAVAAAVAALIKREIDPDFVRQETIKKISFYRNTFFSFIESLQGQASKPQDGRAALQRMMSSAWSCWSYGTIEGIRKRMDDEARAVPVGEGIEER